MSRADPAPDPGPDAASAAREETDRLVAFCGGDELRAFELVHQQLGVLVMRTQVLLSLSGIVITVTGFSGRAIAETSALARLSISAGIVVVLLAALVLVAGVLRVSWITARMSADRRETIAAAIVLRERKARFLRGGMLLFSAGFALYVLAITQLLMAAGTRS
jgi:hypothetical protein